MYSNRQKHQYFVLLGISIICFFLLGCQDEETVKTQSYLTEGRVMYEQKCANCHQKDGSGLRKLIPALTNADRLKSQRLQLACIIKYGRLSMPANNGLSDRHIAQILTYVTHQWAGEQKRWKDEEVKKMLENCETKP